MYVYLHLAPGNSSNGPKLIQQCIIPYGFKLLVPVQFDTINTNLYKAKGLENDVLQSCTIFEPRLYIVFIIKKIGRGVGWEERERGGGVRKITRPRSCTHISGSNLIAPRLYRDRERASLTFQTGTKSRLCVCVCAFAYTRAQYALGQESTPVFFVTALTGILLVSVSKLKYPQSPPRMPFMKATEEADRNEW